jgi:hypothetical protein
MRKSLALAPLLSLCLLLSDCTLFSGRGFTDDDHEVCDKLMDTLIRAMEAGEEKPIREAFAPKARVAPGFEDGLKSLLTYYEGKLVRRNGNVATEDYSNYDYSFSCHDMRYVVETGSRAYRFFLRFQEKDSRTEDNVGVWYLYVLKTAADPTYPRDAYVGDGKEEDGIHVAVPNK